MSKIKELENEIKELKQENKELRNQIIKLIDITTRNGIPIHKPYYETGTNPIFDGKTYC